MSYEYYLPQRTEHQLTRERIRQCKNLGLILDKYPTREAVDESKKRGPWYKDRVADKHIDAQLAEQAYQRWRRAVNAMQAATFTAATQWRTVVGLGGGTVLETDLTLHHLYGIPVIPGSALKGLTRAYVTGEIYKSTKQENDDPVVQRIFGTQKDAGTVIFFDAVPEGGKLDIELDIMNAHYPDYYGKKKLPTNDQPPNPVTFLTVANTTFAFALASRSSANPEHVTLAVGWLQEALQKYGVGGKTSAGYGYFTIAHSEPAVPEPVPARQAEPALYNRPNIPTFTHGSSVGSFATIAASDDLKRRVPEAKAFVRYREFSDKDVVIALEVEEPANWGPGQTINCLFEREEVREGCTVLFCQPGLRRARKKGNMPDGRVSQTT